MERVTPRKLPSGRSAFQEVITHERRFAGIDAELREFLEVIEPLGPRKTGIVVTERVAHHMPANPHNADYLAVKRSKSGHLA